MYTERKADGFTQGFVIFHDQDATGWRLGADRGCDGGGVAHGSWGASGGQARSDEMMLFE